MATITLFFSSGTFFWAMHCLSPLFHFGTHWGPVLSPILTVKTILVTLCPTPTILALEHTYSPNSQCPLDISTLNLTSSAYSIISNMNFKPVP